MPVVAWPAATATVTEAPCTKAVTPSSSVRRAPDWLLTTAERPKDPIDAEGGRCLPDRQTIGVGALHADRVGKARHSRRVRGEGDDNARSIASRRGHDVVVVVVELVGGIALAIYGELAHVAPLVGDEANVTRHGLFVWRRRRGRMTTTVIVPSVSSCTLPSIVTGMPSGKW